MNRKILKYSISLFCLFSMVSLFASYVLSTAKNTTTLLSHQLNYVAGEAVDIQFSVEDNGIYELLVQSSYSTVFLKKESSNKQVHFNLPEFISTKKGSVDYTLYFKGVAKNKGLLLIDSAADKAPIVEAYLGPTSITAGGRDYGMITAMPADIFDNPLEDSTQLAIKYQFLNTLKTDSLLINNFMVWKNIYSEEKSGRILISAKESMNSSKEFTLDIFPSQAEDFKLYENRKHNYADANQVVEFYTSEIKDEFGNTISDGRIVDFVIQDDKGDRINTIGKTINGIARGFIVHPDEQSTWNVKAYIPEMAESNSLELSFLAAVKDFNIHFSDNNREIKVGPITSFMGQLIPDGAIITLSLYRDGQLIDRFFKYTYNGETNFEFLEDFYADGIYQIKLHGLGIKKEIKKYKLK